MFHARRTLTPLAAAAAVLLAAPSGALADRAAIPAEKKRLRAAVEVSQRVPKPIRQGNFKLLRARMSTEGRWGVSTIAPTGRYARSLDAVLGLFRFREGRWRLEQAGTAGVGCTKLVVPRDVRDDLDIECPSG